jgi:superfamily I DNA and/or RNA helicase
MLNYYLNLPKEFAHDPEANMRISYAVMQTAKSSFVPFEKYLQNVINAMEKKEVEAEWEKVKVKNIAKLEMIGRLYKIPKKQSVIEVMDGLGIKEDDVLISSAKGVIKVTKVEGNCVFTDLKVNENEHLFFNNEPVKFTVKKFDKPDGIIVRESDDEYILYSEKKLPNYKSIGQTAIFVDFDNLRFENGEKLKAERSEDEDLNLILENENDYRKSVSDGRIKFRLENIKPNNREAWFIQLKEIENKTRNDEVSALSPLRYFFDDDISVVDDKKNEYSVDFGKETENKIVLIKKENKENKKYKEFCYPESKIIRVKVNTSSLRKQLDAVKSLKDMPVGEHGKLIKLFENRQETIPWKKPECAECEEWFVLTDPQRSGATEQRKFVEQALSTPDFAILEGPPGSGKTTVILELICQLVKLGKRVLLCGSTHVAIDNILERLKEKGKDGLSLIEKFSVLPVRIGEQTRINDDVREFQIDNLREDNNINKNAVELLLDSANLVCGTTTGILQHDKFKKRNEQHNWLTNNDGKKMKKSWFEPIIPEFDCLIIDESSKTTFQEFLMPALYAKKWILAGDCLQLSPFTERDEIVSNIEEILDKNLQSAVFHLHKLNDLLKDQNNKDKNNKFILPVSKEEINEIKKELEKGRLCGQQQYYITKENVNNINTLMMTAYDIIFVDKHILEQALPKLPETHAVLRYDNWNKTQHAFAHNAFGGHDRFYYKERNRDYTDSFEIVKHINEYFLEKNWAEEIEWRIEREHQLRLVEKNSSKDSYRKIIGELIPISQDKQEIEDKINMVAVMAFPSILESLTKGIKGRKVKFESTISDGFKEEDLRLRKTTLRYQHRMHPQISKFPRETFYKGGALLDLTSPSSIEELRQWKYDKYANRSVWVDILGEDERNKNIKEAESLMEHLISFVEFAKENEKSQGKKEWSIACLTFYTGQEWIIREELRRFTGKIDGVSNFNIKGNGKCDINIKLHTVDKFQGHEADVVFLSMVRNKWVGFMDNPNRLNVAITRAKFQLVVFGNKEFFAKGRHKSDELRNLAKSMEVYK